MKLNKFRFDFFFCCIICVQANEMIEYNKLKIKLRKNKKKKKSETKLKKEDTKKT